MAVVGDLIREGVDFDESGLAEPAFVAAAQAVRETLVKFSGNEDPGLSELKEFVDGHWDLIFFMSFPAVKSPYIDVKFVIKEISLNPRRRYTVREILIYLLSYALRNKRLPEDIGFKRSSEFELRNGKLLIPSSVTGGLLAFAVVHPVNADEKIPEKYWISIADFKMFVSELWGRMDIAERVRKFYITR